MADAVHLEHKQQFIALLRDYHLHTDAPQLFEKLRFVVLSGIAGGGRNTVIKHLVKHQDYYFIVSDTTRPPKMRDGKLEQHGQQYWFRTEDEMLADIRDGKFLEAELIHDQQVSGTSLRELEYAAMHNKTAVAEVEYGGANRIAAINPGAFIIGLLPPSYEEWLRRFRGREEITDQEFRNRLLTAEKVLENMLTKPYFHLVVNDTVAQCAAHIQEVVAGTYSRNEEARANAVAKSILEEMERTLAV